MIAHARAIGDATLERKLLHELHATAAHSEEATPSILSGDVDDSAIDALHEAVAATPRDPAAWLALARAHTERRDWHEGVLASFPAVLLAEQSVNENGATAAAAAAKRLLGRCAAMLLPKGWLPAANGSLEWVAASLECATAAAAQRGGRVDRLRVWGVGLSVAALHTVASAGHSRAAPRRLELSSHPTLGPLLSRALQAAGSRVALSEVSVYTHSAPGARGGGGGGGAAVVVDQHGTRSEGAAVGGEADVDLLLWEVPLVPSAPLLDHTRAMAAGLRCTAAVWPRRLEVWAAIVDGRGGGGSGGGGSVDGGDGCGGDSGDGCGGKQALDELLNVRPSLHGFSMEPLRAHLQAAQPLLPLDVTRWRAAPLAPPTCVYRCEMRAPSEVPPSTAELQPAAASSVPALPPASWYELTADASGVATAVVLWTQL